MCININILPPEMVERILKLLYFKEVCQARLICKRWKKIIVGDPQKPQGIFRYMEKRIGGMRAITMPPLTQTLGIWINKNMFS